MPRYGVEYGDDRGGKAGVCRWLRGKSSRRVKEEVVSRREIRKAVGQEARLIRRELKRARARRRRRRCLFLALVGGAAAAAAQASKGKAEQLPPGGGTVTMREAEPNPLAYMMGELVKGFIRDPYKRKVADRMNVSIAVQDLEHPEMAATMIFRASDVEVANGVIEGAGVYVHTELALLLSLARIGKGKQILAWLQGEEGQKMLRAVAGGRFKVRGAVKNAQQLALFQRFLTP